MAKKNATKPVEEPTEPTNPPPAGQDDTAPVEGAVVVMPPAEEVAEPATTQAAPEAAASPAPEPPPDPRFELDPASLKTVNALLPQPKAVDGYRKREYRIGIEEAEALNKLWGGLQQHNARLKDGRKIETPDNALAWLLQTYLASA